MKIVRYLAISAARMQAIPRLPEAAAWMSCHFSRSFHNLFYRKTNSISKIKYIAVISITKILHCKNMSLCKIIYMNIVSDTSTILCVIVRSINRNILSLFIWHLQN